MRRPTWHLGPMPFFGYGAFGGASDSAQSALLDAMERFLPLPSFDGTTNEDQLVDGMNKAAAVLQAEGVDLSSVSEDRPPQAYQDASVYASNNGDAISALLTNTLPSMTSLLQTINPSSVPPAPLQWSHQDVVDVMAYAWRVASGIVPSVYGTAADVQMIQDGVLDQQTVAVDIRRRMMVFRFIVMLQEQGIFAASTTTPASTSGFGSGISFAGLGIAWTPGLILGIGFILALLIVSIVWVVMSIHSQNVAMDKLCFDPITRLPDDVRNTVCPGLVKNLQDNNKPPPGLPGLDTAIWVLGGVALAYLLIVYGIPQYQASEKRLATS